MQPAVFGFDNFGTATYKDGVLYAPSKGDDSVCAIDALSGQITWQSTVRQCDASPCIDDEVIYVGEAAPSAKALALNKKTGRVIWQFVDPGNRSWVGSPLVHGGLVFYTTQGSGVYALNKSNGNPIWHQNIGSLVCSAAYHDGVVFVSARGPPGQYAFNATTGDEIWHVNYGASWDSSPVVHNKMIIQVIMETGKKKELRKSIYSTCVLNETTGELLRKFEDKGSPSTPLVFNGKIFIPDDDFRIWAFDLTTGDELWHTVELHNGAFQELSYCSPAASGGAVYYQSLNGTFYVINERNGDIHWAYPLKGFGFGSPSIGDGCVFITNDYALYAFKIGPGSGDWPMFCHNNLHVSYSEYGIEHVSTNLRTIQNTDRDFQICALTQNEPSSKLPKKHFLGEELTSIRTRT